MKQDPDEGGGGMNGAPRRPRLAPPNDAHVGHRRGLCRRQGAPPGRPRRGGTVGWLRGWLTRRAGRPPPLRTPWARAVLRAGVGGGHRPAWRQATPPLPLDPALRGVVSPRCGGAGRLPRRGWPAGGRPGWGVWVWVGSHRARARSHRGRTVADSPPLRPPDGAVGARVDDFPPPLGGGGVVGRWGRFPCSWAEGALDWDRRRGGWREEG